ncbi:Pnap_2097 family protein [Dechloromonas hortensis]|uniref:Pnap_2097 family protein n=1 Tax=Dechloromonas hortensis TaxID=337779 RepID=UPI001291E46D|nr:Pnap_2097 family protein [Dechloromonas hortensis]
MQDSTLFAVSPNHQQLSERYRIGMPQLSLNGLSEKWLLAECGDRHWRLIEQAAGVVISQLRDARLRRVYPAFRSIRLRQAMLDSVIENDLVEICSTLGRVSRTQFYSKHVISVNDGLCAVVDMLSVFIAREKTGINSSAIRSQVSGIDNIGELAEGFQFAERVRAIPELRQESDAQRWSRPTHSYASIPVCPCPSIHFNGAGFMYFASFHELIDQAEWSWFGPEVSNYVTTERHIIFHGNVDIGNSVIISLCDFERTERQQHHHTQIIRRDDQKVIADVITRRRARSSSKAYIENLFDLAA